MMHADLEREERRARLLRQRIAERKQLHLIKHTKVRTGRLRRVDRGRTTEETLRLARKPVTTLDPRTGQRSLVARRECDDGDFYMRIPSGNALAISDKSEVEATRDSSCTIPLLRTLNVADGLEGYRSRLGGRVQSVIGIDACDDTIQTMLRAIGEYDPDMDDGHLDMIWRPPRSQSDASGEGYARVRKFLTLLDSLELTPGVPMRRSTQQVSFHNAILGATLPAFFGKHEWPHQSAHAPGIFNVSADHREVIISAPRQNGKTEAGAAFLACMLVTIPGIRIAVFSKTKQQCQNLLSRTMNLLQSIPGAAGRFDYTKTTMIISYRHGGADARLSDVSQIQAYSSITDNARGLSATVLFIDEMAFILRNFFETVIVPLLGVANTALIGISTPSPDARNFFNTLMESENTDTDNDDVKPGEAPRKGFFHTVTIMTNVCPACSAMDKKECMHAMLQQPSWKPAARLGKVKRLLKESSATFNREAMGILTEGTRFAFDRHHVDRLLHSMPFDLMQHQVPRLVVGVDPTGHGDSELGICSIIVMPRGYRPIGIDNSGSSSSNRHPVALHDGRHSFIVRCPFPLFCRCNCHYNLTLGLCMPLTWERARYIAESQIRCKT